MDHRYQDAMTAQREAVHAALAAQQRAVDKAEEQGLRWREQANEWRAAMSDRERHFVPRTEADARTSTQAIRVDELSKQVDKLAERLDQGQGHSAGLGAGWKYLTSFIGLILVIITIVSTIIIIVSR